MNRIGRVRAKHHVARRCDGLRHIGETFLGTERGHDLRVRVELYAETARIILSLRTAQPGIPFDEE